MEPFVISNFKKDSLNGIEWMNSKVVGMYIKMLFISIGKMLFKFFIKPLGDGFEYVCHFILFVLSSKLFWTLILTLPIAIFVIIVISPLL